MNCSKHNNNNNKSKICCICFEENASIFCSTCTDGSLCIDCFDKQIEHTMIDHNILNCPICRTPNKYAMYYAYIYNTVSDFCYIGILWIIGYINLLGTIIICNETNETNNKINLHTSPIYSSKYYNYIITHGCIIIGYIILHGTRFVIASSLNELDEFYFEPYVDPNQSELEFQEYFKDYRTRTNKFCFNKRVVHFLARCMNMLNSEYSMYVNIALNDPNIKYRMYVKYLFLLTFPHII